MSQLNKGSLVNNPEYHLAPGILTLTATSNSTNLSINNRIPIQTIVLREVRVEYNNGGGSGTASALAQRVIYIDLPFLSTDQLTDNTAFFNLPIALDNALVTIKQLETPVYLNKAIDTEFKMYIRSSDGSLVSMGGSDELAHVYLQFTHDYTGN